MKNCRNFYPDRPPGFRKGEPEACLAYGEILERNGKKETAVQAYKKACGLDFIVPAYLNSGDAVKREKGIDHLRSYGCMTISEEKKYNLKDIPYCTPQRVTACIRLGYLLTDMEKPDQAKKYFERACVQVIKRLVVKQERKKIDGGSSYMLRF